MIKEKEIPFLLGNFKEKKWENNPTKLTVLKKRNYTDGKEIPVLLMDYKKNRFVD